MMRVPRVAALTAAAFLSSVALSAAGQFGQPPAAPVPQTAPPQGTPPPSARVPGQTRPSTPPPSSGQQGRRDEPRLQPQGFSVVLVLADLTSTTAQDDVPPAARRALADMKDFLPYKSYKLLDAAWLLGQGSSGGVTRLRGPEDQEYELRLSAYPVPSSNGRVQVQFSLRDGGVEHVDTTVARDNERRTTTETEMKAREAELDRLQRELVDAKKRNDATQVRSLERRIASVRDAMALTRSVQNRKSMPSRAIMDTSFAMEVGETVVVGTSRLRGNTRALIALLTAVPPRAGRTETTR
jgi:hypothetical protein